MNRRTQLISPLLVALTALFGAGCSDDDEGAAGTIDVQISGENAATDGFLFPTGSDVTFADGWELRFTHVLVTVGNVTISSNPNRSPSDQSATGAAVARVSGPWAVDLGVEGTAPGAGGEGRATPITTIENQNLKGGEPFAADEQYAFGFEIVEASADATRLNFDGDVEAEAAYGEMIDNGYAMLLVGTATFQGTDCATSDPDYDFSAIPETLEFSLGFTTPTEYVNCQNQENQGAPFDGEEYPRGIAILPNKAALAQVTLHIEHPWFSDVVHDSDLYFDQMAATLVGKPDGSTLTMAALEGLDPVAFTDGAGAALPWRVCTDAALASGQRGFGVGSIPVDPTGDPATSFRDYRDYVHYLESTLGHLNGGEGLCFVRRSYPSPD